MNIINLTPESNGAYANQNWAGEAPPDGYVAIPEEFSSVWEQYKPFVTIGFTDGVITSMVDNPTARTAQEEADAARVVQPTLADKNRADIDFLAIMTGVSL